MAKKRKSKFDVSDFALPSQIDWMGTPEFSKRFIDASFDDYGNVTKVDQSQMNCCGKTLNVRSYPNVGDKATCIVCGNLFEWEPYRAYAFPSGWKVTPSKFNAAINELNMKSVTPKTWLGIYTSWCMKNSTFPIRYDVLDEIFLGCETNQDFDLTLNVLFDINSLAQRLSFMTAKNADKPTILINRIRLRLILFSRIPSVTNMLLAYNLIEELTVEIYKSNKINMDMKVLEKFDKLKNLALGTKFIEERKLAFTRSLDAIEKVTNLKIREDVPVTTP